jgi:hypothetical protein
VATGKIGHTRPSYELVTKLQALHEAVFEKIEIGKAEEASANT